MGLTRSSAGTFGKEGKVRSRRIGIDGGCRLAVLLEVSEHVHEAVTHRARGRECSLVPALGKDASFPKAEAIDAPCDAHRKTRHSSRERRTIPSLDDQMEVVELHREMNDPEGSSIPSIRVRDPTMDRRKNERRPKRAKQRPEYYVYRICRAMSCPRAMPHATARSRPLPSRALPTPTPRIRKGQDQLAPHRSPRSCQPCALRAKPRHPGLLTRLQITIQYLDQRECIASFDLRLPQASGF